MGVGKPPPPTPRSGSTVGFLCFVALLAFLACGCAVLYGTMTDGTDGPRDSAAWKAAIVLWLVGAAAAGLATWRASRTTGDDTKRASRAILTTWICALVLPVMPLTLLYVMLLILWR